MSVGRKPRKLGETDLWEFAVRALSGRAHSAGELRQKLLRKAEHAEDVDRAIARAKELGYLNDARFAESFASARLSNQGLGKRKVLRDLRGRRIAPETAGRAVEQAYAEADEVQLIESFIRRKYRSHTEPLFQDRKELASAYRKLLYAGFSPGNSIKVLKRFAENPELLDDIEQPE
ncbi:MAG: regulatory protein RecX [Bryobacteraceae bacterium]